MIMSRLFTALITGHGVTVVTTSNRAPGELYKDGLNREHFLPFIALIENRLDIVALNGPTDYRLARMQGVGTWHVPNGSEATAAVREAFFRLTDYPPEDSVNVPAGALDLGGGRMLHVPKSLKGVAVFSFKRLCAEARGAADYLAIARNYHTVILVGVPRLGPDQRNEAARFVKGRSGDLARLEPLEEGGFVDQSAARAVDDAHAGFHDFDPRRVHEMFGLGRHRHVQGDEVGLGDGFLAV
jgi:cell division protein ZapE